MDNSPVIAELLDRCRRDQQKWMNGDASGYRFSGEDVTIMGGFGGVGVGEAAISPGQARAVAQFESGAGEIELVNAGTSGDVAWLVMIERGTVTFVGRSKSVRWALRVTEIFQNDGQNWQRVHRHADPFVDRHSLDEVLSLLTS